MIFEILREYNLTLGTAIALVEAIALYEQLGFQHSLNARAAVRHDQAWELDLTQDTAYACAMKLGLISDTHGHVPNAVHAALAGVDYILHAGDVGPMDVITELEVIAPVHAVLGNTDYGIALPVTRLEEFGGRKILIHHIVDVDFPSQTVRELLSREHPEVVVFGHTHMPFDELRSRIRFINPGSASQPRGGTAPSVAILELSGETPTLQSIALQEY